MFFINILCFGFIIKGVLEVEIGCDWIFVVVDVFDIELMIDVDNILLIYFNVLLILYIGYVIEDEFDF